MGCYPKFATKFHLNLLSTITTGISASHIRYTSKIWGLYDMITHPILIYCYYLFYFRWPLLCIRDSYWSGLLPCFKEINLLLSLISLKLQRANGALLKLCHYVLYVFTMPSLTPICNMLVKHGVFVIL